MKILHDGINLVISVPCDAFPTVAWKPSLHTSAHRPFSPLGLGQNSDPDCRDDVLFAAGLMEAASFAESEDQWRREQERERDQRKREKEEDRAGDGNNDGSLEGLLGDIADGEGKRLRVGTQP